MLLYVFLIFGFDYQITRDIKIAGDIFWLLQVSCCTLYILWLDEFSIIDPLMLIAQFSYCLLSHILTSFF